MKKSITRQVDRFTIVDEEDEVDYKPKTIKVPKVKKVGRFTILSISISSSPKASSPKAKKVGRFTISKASSPKAKKVGRFTIKSLTNMSVVDEYSNFKKNYIQYKLGKSPPRTMPSPRYSFKSKKMNIPPRILEEVPKDAIPVFNSIANFPLKTNIFRSKGDLYKHHYYVNYRKQPMKCILHYNNKEFEIER